MDPIYFKQSKSIPSIPWRKCWAKTNDNNEVCQTVLEHNLIVSKVMECLLQDYVLPSIRRLIPKNIKVVGGLHDVGKISPGFEGKHKPFMQDHCPELVGREGFETNHAVISEAALIDYYNKKKNCKNNKVIFSEMVGIHHGTRSIALPHDCEQYGGKSWAKERLKFIDFVINKLGPLPSKRIDPKIQDVITGLMAVADWIGSGIIEPISNKKLKVIVKKKMIEIGWKQYSYKKNLTFKEIFNGYTPNPLQSMVIEKCRGRGIYVIEDVMGEGKTEAGLYLAYSLLEEGVNNGIYFGLPTQLTSQRIHKRFAGFLNNIVLDVTKPKVIHGNSILFEDVGLLKSGEDWFSSNKKAILYPFAVGTIDQAILSVINVKHSFVRAFGLAGKVVILDEVHSFDVYTSTLIKQLIKTLVDLQCTVIILSATLTPEAKKELLVDFGEPENITDHYPLITKYDTDNKKVTCYPVKVGSVKKIQIELWKSSYNSKKVYQKILKYATSGSKILWIANSVPQAQRIYNLFESQSSGLDIGLLHSRISNFQKTEEEEKWMNIFGKNSTYEGGCILVATQVVEQSVDIDADLIISEIAPMDLLLQRIGRLWRHLRLKRGCKFPRFIINVPEISKCKNDEEFIELVGDTSYIYPHYLLLKTYDVLRNLKTITLPSDIRSLLRRTYDFTNDAKWLRQPWIQDLKKCIETKKDHLKKLANVSLVESLQNMRDDERASTRHSTMPSVSVLMVKKVVIKKRGKYGDRATITLFNGDVIDVEEYWRDKEVTKKIYNVAVKTPISSFGNIEFEVPSYLNRHCSGLWQVMILKENGDLCFLNGENSGNSYLPKLGFIRGKKD